MMKIKKALVKKFHQKDIKFKKRLNQSLFCSSLERWKRTKGAALSTFISIVESIVLMPILQRWYIKKKFNPGDRKIRGY